MKTLALYVFLTSASYFLGSRATITEFLWSRYPPIVDRFMLCAACAGTWYGFACGSIGWWLDLPFLGLDGRHWFTVVAVGAGAMVWTPILSVWHIAALERLQGGEESAELPIASVTGAGRRKWPK